MVLNVDTLRKIFGISEEHDFSEIVIRDHAIIIPVAKTFGSFTSVPVCIYDAVNTGVITVDIASDMRKYYETTRNMRNYTLEQRIVDISLGYDLIIADDVMLWVKLQ